LAKSASESQHDLQKDVASYIQSGEHAFIACDDPNLRNDFVRFLQGTLAGSPIEYIDSDRVSRLRDFAVAIVESCRCLVTTIASLPMERTPGIANSLKETMLAFDAAERQGFLIIDNIDSVIEMQRTIEIEGPLRSVMQIHNDVAVVLCGSNRVINDMVGSYDRPFYMSFRVFRL